MPRKSAIKCYFRCVTEGPFHQFPKPDSNRPRFEEWKMVLNDDVQKKGDSYIFNNLRLCDRHFKECYHSFSKRLIGNAVPTLNLGSSTNSHQLKLNIENTQPMNAEYNSVSSENANTTQVITMPNNEKSKGSSASQLQFHTSTASEFCNVKEDNSVSEKTTQVVTKTNIRKGKQHCKVTTQTLKVSKDLRVLNIRILKLKNKCKTLQQKVRQASKLSKSPSFLKSVERLPETVAIFTKMQIRKTSKMPRGRRYTMKEKILSLAIYKQSQKAYNLLQRIFTLPSKRTLQKMLSSISLSPGINENIMEHLKKAASNLPDEKKLCTLIFDEVSLSPGLFYQKQSDEIVGFEDFGCRKTSLIADHALVFMLKSLKGKYKQPICYTFCQSATKSADLKKLIKAVILQVNTTGLKIVATVCDQSTTNICVIKSLFNDTKDQHIKDGDEYRSLAFEVDGTKIFPIFDPPHVLKGLRNNLMTKNLKFVQNGETKLAKWEHLQMLLDADVGEDDIRLVNKLTENHVNKDKVPKMKVKHAAQVFSQRVSAAMRFLANHNILPKECLATADLLLLIDKLFDSFNGHSYGDGAKKYKCALRKTSPHFGLWNEMLPVLHSMKFITQKNGSERFVQVPSLKNWIDNIEVMKEMFSFLNTEHDISSLLTRNINQDPLENFFCNIRSNGIRNVNPTCSQFTGAYKTILVNNLTSPHSVGANCERDNSKILKPLKCLINKSKVREQQETGDVNVDSLINLFNTKTQKPSNITNKEAKRYVAGYLVHKGINKLRIKCLQCKMQLCSTTPPTNNDYILERDYTNRSLTYPSEALCSFLDEVCMVIQMQLNEEPQQKGIKKMITEKVKIFCDFSFLSCEQHKNQTFNYLISLINNVIIHSWCTNVNRLLKGKISCTNVTDTVKTQAVKYHKTHVHKRKNKK